MKISPMIENAPFSPEQKNWLAGFFAGLHTQIAQNSNAGEQEALLPVHVFYGTQTGNSEAVAEDICAALTTGGMAPQLASLDDIELEDFANLDHVLIVISTYGEGEMPDNAQLFWDALSATDAPRLEHMHFSVLALGDTSYDGFCEAGKQLDLRLEQLGAKRMHARFDCDVDFEETAENWTTGVLEKVSEFKGQGGVAGAVAAAPAKKAEKSKWTRKNPFEAPLSVNRLLSGEGSAKEIRHFEIDLSNDGPQYEAGDALGVIPANDPALVEAWAQKLGVSLDDQAPGFDATIGEVLGTQLEISTPSADLMRLITARAEDEHLSHIWEHGDKDTIDNFLWSKDALDLVTLYPKAEVTLEDMLSVFKPLQHRAYSISSSSKMHTDSVHLTVAAVRYDSHGRKHGGVASTFLADRVAAGQPVKVFVSPNKSFRVPTDNDVPMIMVGPGTGIAPFRAFLQERQALGAKGMNWLFFGDQHASCDFIYQDELEAMQSDGILSRLDLAFSRDQAEKIYVQTRMMEQSKDLYAALEEGGHFYVCGDASRMAKDVDQALHNVIAKEGALTEDGAREYVNRLKKEKRYLRDVY
ncbi:sulfite reductase subunit alpha [Rhodobacteraceae bacterium RKSG542]|uniref:sulfite reductase subunit alpha n=1 Tax=Pseudovibrio flavus TaxID=2529854 RepID=UPI0012BD02A6|nr:sulfite reductase subunit alpha [Pseudovibrio flavus]MTI15849.1 sulfite reductase subunit alpha [Pseudovibrio flavus]